jgi:hypothetical protein
MRLPLIACLIVLSSAAPALASGGIWCTSGAGQAKFEVSAGMGRDFGSGLFNLNGTLKADVADVDKSLIDVTFSDATAHQVWIDRGLLFLELMAQRPGNGPYGSSDLVIKTSTVDEGSYVGKYTLTITDSGVDAGGEAQNIEISGAVTCGAD